MSDADTTPDPNTVDLSDSGDLKVKEYFSYYLYVWLGFIIIRVLMGTLITFPYVVSGFIAFFMVDPNLGKIIFPNKHRWWLTHSIVYPVILYWGFFRWYIDMAAVIPTNKANEVGLLLFLPILVHLVRDFWEDTHAKEWTIKLYPLPLTLSRKTSIVWIVLNCAGILAYMIVLMVI